MRIRTPRELGAVLRDERRRLGLSQVDLSVKADVSRKWIVQMENGKARAELALVLRTIGVLGLVLTVERRAGHDQRVDRRGGRRGDGARAPNSGR
jgi:HTH-type transcriptional regulator / antitoxin HipB